MENKIQHPLGYGTDILVFGGREATIKPHLASSPASADYRIVFKDDGSFAHIYNRDVERIVVNAKDGVKVGDMLKGAAEGQVIIEKDMVNHPAHYGGDNPLEVIKIIDAYDMNFTEGSILKYLLRYKKKNGMEDLKKAQWYLNRLIEKIK